MNKENTSLFSTSYSVRARLIAFLIAAVCLVVFISLTAIVGLSHTYNALNELRDKTLEQMFSSMTLGVKTAQISTYATRLTQTVEAMEYKEESARLAEQAAQLHNLLKQIAQLETSAPADTHGSTPLITAVRTLADSVQELLLQTHRRHILRTAILSELHQMMLDLRHIRRLAERSGQTALSAQLDELNRLLENAAAGQYSAGFFRLLTGEFARLTAFAGFESEREALHTAFARIHTQAQTLDDTQLRITFLLHQINSLVKNINTRYTDLAERQVDFATVASTQAQNDIYRNILVILGFSLLTLAIIAVSGRYIYAVIGRRLYSIIAALKALSQGNRHITVPQQQSQDEIGDLARAFNIFHQNVILLEQTDHLLKEKSEWLEQTFLAMRDGLAIFDLQNNILSCNTAFRALLPDFYDTPGAARTLTDLADYFQNRQATISGHRAPLNADTLRSCQEPFEIECGQHIFEWRISPLQGGIVAFLIDRTHRRQLETDLAHSQKMRTIGHITGGIAHDFNNLLAVIIGNLGLIDQDTLSDKQRKYLRRALQAADNSATLTQRLLAYARKQPLHPAVLDIRRLIINFKQLVKHTLPPGIRFTLELPDNLPPVYMDKNLLETALVNLIVNAKDAVGDTGHICIRAKSCLVKRRHRDERMLQLSVTDDGCGMSEDTRARAFEPFFTTKSGGKGSGLGLSMVYGFIRQSQGRVVVESAPEQGTTIHLQLPLAPHIAAEHTDTHHTSIEPRRAAGHVLLVEDQSALRDTLREQLNALGYRVTACADGEDALQQLDTQNIDLLLSDIVLPGKTGGIHIAEHAQRHHPDIRIILMTGHYAALGEGQIPFTVLKKPFNHAELEQALLGATPYQNDKKTP